MSNPQGEKQFFQTCLNTPWKSYRNRYGVKDALQRDSNQKRPAYIFYI